MDGDGMVEADRYSEVDLGPRWFIDQLASCWMPLTSWHMLQLELLEVTTIALQNMPWGWPPLDRIAKMAIHTDGATSLADAAWANVLIATDVDGIEWFCGTYSGQVELVQGPRWIGAERHTSSAAELSGVTWALQVALQFAGTISQVEIWYDSKYASGIAQAFLQPSSHSVLAVIAAGLDTLLRQFVNLSWHYEAGHKGNP